MSQLFSPLVLRGLTIRNRVFAPPMCQYSATNGVATAWHHVHYGGLAVGGAGLVVLEATGVVPEGRISPYDLGLWNEEQAHALASVAHFLKEQGAVAAIQLAHAGRKASTDAPWNGGGAVDEKSGGWQPVAPSPLAFSDKHPMPRALSVEDISQIPGHFAAAARRALEAGFHVVEVHMAHGYLLHQFLSPLTNWRDDAYGGSLEGRARLPLAVARAVREAWPANLPIFVRISATDWVEGGWDLAQSIELCGWLREIGVDLIDVSSGGLTPDARIPAAPGFQTPFAAAIRQKSGISVGTVGLITDPAQAEHALVTGQADAVFLGRELLRNPRWPLQAARALGDDVPWPRQYLRAKLG